MTLSGIWSLYFYNASHTIRELGYYINTIKNEYLSLVCTLATRLSTSVILRILSSFVVGAGIEPARTQCPLDFKSNVSTNSTTRPKVLTNKSKNYFSSGGGIRTPDLQVMSLTSYQLLYPTM